MTHIISGHIVSGYLLHRLCEFERPEEKGGGDDGSRDATYFIAE
jgi:hypothetical protein